MNHPESPHQAAIARPSVPEVTGPFSKKVRPELSPEAAELVRVYDSTYGSASPGCCPEALAAVLDAIAEEPAAVFARRYLTAMALQLRGKSVRSESP